MKGDKANGRRQASFRLCLSLRGIVQEEGREDGSNRRNSISEASAGVNGARGKEPSALRLPFPRQMASSEQGIAFRGLLLQYGATE
jgi:hypothetical protein